MSWYDTDDFDYAYFRMVWDDPPWQGADAPAGAIPELLLDSLQQLADEYQRMFDELAEHARGMAVDDIKPALATCVPPCPAAFRPVPLHSTLPR